MKIAKKLLSIAMMLVMALAVTSCKKGKAEIEYFPFQSSENGNWGLISLDGEVLFEEEFDEEITSAVNGRFFVKTKKGEWQIYTADKKPERVGGTYYDICPFTADVTPAVKKGECIKLIDRDGKEVRKLDKIDGKKVLEVSSFEYGFANVDVESKGGSPKSGIINTDGEWVVKPKYDAAVVFSENVLCGYEANSDAEKYTFHFFDGDGDERLTLKTGVGEKYSDVETISDDYIAVSMKASGGKNSCGIINYDKEIVLRPTTKIARIHGFQGDNFTFSTEDGKYGVMNVDGSELIRAKYNCLTWVSDDILIATDASYKDYLINLKGEKVSSKKYTSIYYPRIQQKGMFGTPYVMAAAGENEYVFLGLDGEELEGKNVPAIYDFVYTQGSSYVRSQVGKDDDDYEEDDDYDFDYDYADVDSVWYE